MMWSQILAAVSALASCSACVAATRVFEERSGIVSMEAEHATSASGWAETDVPASSGVTMRDEGGSLEYTIHFTHTGNYFIWFRHMKPKGATDGSNDCFVFFDRAKAHVRNGSGRRPEGMGTHNTILDWQSRPKTHEADDRSKHVYITVDVSGTHEFAVKSRSRGYLVDKICLVHENAGGNDPRPNVLEGMGPPETVAGEADGSRNVLPMTPDLRAMLGDEPYVKLEPLALRCGRNEQLGPVIAVLRRKVSSRDEDEATEARRMLDALFAHARRELDEALSRQQSDPYACLMGLEGLVARYRSCREVTDEASTVIRKLRADPRVRTEIAADRAWQGIEQLRQRIKPRGGSRDLGDSDVRRANRELLAAIAARCQALMERYPGTQAAKTAENLLRKLP